MRISKEIYFEIEDCMSERKGEVLQTTRASTINSAMRTRKVANAFKRQLCLSVESRRAKARSCAYLLWLIERGLD